MDRFPYGMFCDKYMMWCDDVPDLTEDTNDCNGACEHCNFRQKIFRRLNQINILDNVR